LLSLSLRIRLILIILVALIPAGLFLIYDAIAIQRRIQADTYDELLRLSQLTAISYEQRLDEAHRMLMGISLFPEVSTSDAASCSARLAQMVEIYQPQYRGFGVSNLKGEMFCTSASISPTVQIADRMWFRDAVRTGEFALANLPLAAQMETLSWDWGCPYAIRTGKSGVYYLMAYC